MRAQAVITPEEYEFVKCRMEKLVDAVPCSEEAKELKELTKLTHEFEAEQLHQLLVKLWC